jgi:hypothetical protein
VSRITNADIRYWQIANPPELGINEFFLLFFALITNIPIFAI